MSPLPRNEIDKRLVPKENVYFYKFTYQLQTLSWNVQMHLYLKHEKGDTKKQRPMFAQAELSQELLLKDLVT